MTWTTDELLKRLRKHEFTAYAMDRAANEIEQLRAAIEMVLVELGPFLNDDPHSRIVRDRLRRALKQTDH